MKIYIVMHNDEINVCVQETLEKAQEYARESFDLEYESITIEEWVVGATQWNRQWWQSSNGDWCYIQ